MWSGELVRGEGGLDEALNKKSSHAMSRWHGVARAYETNVSVITSITCNILQMSKYSICIKDNFVRWEAKLPAAGNLEIRHYFTWRWHQDLDTEWHIV